LQNDPAILATLLSLSCMLPIRHMTANIFQWQKEMFSLDCLLDEQPLTTKMHYMNECIMCNRSQSTNLHKNLLRC
jgi:hypothetical protein